ncbi:hypothetical protein AAAC51_32360 [Priestia megaterium]
MPIYWFYYWGIPELLNKEFIFSNGSVEEICRNLEAMNLKAMHEEAIRSFEKAKEYDYSKLDVERNNFYKAFSLGINNGGKNES